MENPGQVLSEDELFALNHYSRYGSDGYPIRKGKNGKWWVEGIRGCGAFPVPYKTKREASAQWERYISILMDRKAGRL